MGNITTRGAENRLDALSIEEVEKHNSRDDAWLILFGDAIDVTRFLPIHPGGEESISSYLGKDATEAWVEIHTPETLERNLHLLRKVGKMQPRGGLLSWLLQRLLATRSCEAKATDAEEAKAPEDKELPGLSWSPEHDQDLPADGIFTLASLSRWDGRGLPMLIAICGKVIDVSPSHNFLPNSGYGKLWAGKDCTWAMANVSLKAQDANKLDFDLSDLGELQFQALAGWYKHFTEKYRVVGSLHELLGRDFSSAIEAAEEMKQSASLGLPLG